MNNDIAVSMQHITKAFGTKVVANDDVCLDVKKGEILALLGENGSGKTTLMNMLSGIYHPDSGKIFVDSKEVVIRSPKDAFDLGIGMIHQHFKLVDLFTATENIALGMKKNISGSNKEIAKGIKDICDRYGFDVDPDQKVYNMSVSQKQTLEIVKTLYRGANILILDEPTAVLTPQETEKLFSVLLNMKKDGKSIIIITHKLNEVLAISDRVSILRKGKYICTIDTKEATVMSLTEAMVGQKIELNIQRNNVENKEERLIIEHLTCLNKYGAKALDDITFTAYSGEILGIAGISGSGQKELLEAISGLQLTEEGSSIIYVKPETKEKTQLIGKTVKQIRDLGVAMSFVPEDRLGMGLVGTMGMAENMMLKTYKDNRFMFTSVEIPENLPKRKSRAGSCYTKYLYCSKKTIRR